VNSSLFILACVWYNFRPSSLQMTVTLNRAGCLTFGHSTYKDTHIDGGIAINWHDGCFQRKPIGYCRTPDFWCMKWPQTTAILPYCQTQTYYCLQMDCWLGIVHVVHPSGRPKNATFDWTRSPQWMTNMAHEKTIYQYQPNFRLFILMKRVPSMGETAFIIPRFAKLNWLSSVGSMKVEGNLSGMRGQQSIVIKNISVLIQKRSNST
jgi:hypothetical protein